MRIILKLFAVPVALTFVLAAALCSLALSISGVLFSIASTIGGIASVALFVTGQVDGGIVFLIVAFLISPFGLPSVAACFVRVLDGVGGILKSFIFS